MDMRALAVCVCALVVSLGSTPTNGHAAGRECGVPRSHTILKGRYVVVVKRSQRAWACLRSNGIAHELGSDAWAPVRTIRLNKWGVAFEESQSDCSDCARVGSLNLRTGRRLWSYSPKGLLPVTRLVVDGAGRAAWVALAEPAEVHKMDGAGEDVLDTGTEIVGSSLVLRDGHVRWRHGSQIRSVALEQRRRCARPNTTTLDENKEVRVYWRAEYVYGCVKATRRNTRIGRKPSDQFEYYGGDELHLAGHVASVDEGYAGREGAYIDLQVVNLATGRLVHRWSAGNESSIGHVVLHPSGGVAWMAFRTSRFEVRKSDADGEAVLIDSSTDGAIDQKSLRLEGRRVSWLHGGETRSAKLR